MVGRTWPDITETIAHQTACYPFQTLLNTKRQTWLKRTSPPSTVHRVCRPTDHRYSACDASQLFRANHCNRSRQTAEDYASQVVRAGSSSDLAAQASRMCHRTNHLPSVQSVHEEWRVSGTAQASPRTATTQKIHLGSGRRQLLSSHLQSPLHFKVHRTCCR